MGLRDIFQILVLFVIFIAFFIWIIYLIGSIKLKNRIKGSTVKLKNNENVSFIDRIVNYYIKSREKLVKSLIPKKKYIEKKKDIKELYNLVDSIYSSFIALVLYFGFSIFYLHKPSFLVIVLVLIVGFLIPGIIKQIRFELDKKNIDKNLLKAIILINNDINAGKTIKESIKDTSLRLEGAIKVEFTKVIDDLDHGLSLEVAFKRMQDRCKVDDVVYLATTLTILSKTGGNIKLVFTYLEKLFRTRKSLDRELKVATASSNFVFMVLSVLPIIVIFGMYIMYDNFIGLFISSPLGILLGISIITLYIVYVYTIRKVIKIEKY